jgi:hypothetical protein
MCVQTPIRRPNNNNNNNNNNNSNNIIETCVAVCSTRVIVSTNPSFLSPEINNYYCLLRAHIVGDSPRRGGARHVTVDCAFDSRSCTHMHVSRNVVTTFYIKLYNIILSSVPNMAYTAHLIYLSIIY